MPVDDAKGANNIQNVVNDPIYDVWRRRRTISTTLDLMCPFEKKEVVPCQLHLTPIVLRRRWARNDHIHPCRVLRSPCPLPWISLSHPAAATITERVESAPPPLLHVRPRASAAGNDCHPPDAPRALPLTSQPCATDRLLAPPLPPPGLLSPSLSWKLSTDLAAEELLKRSPQQMKQWYAISASETKLKPMQRPRRPPELAM